MTRVLKNDGKAIIVAPNSHSLIFFGRVLKKGTIYNAKKSKISSA
jgi:hypothetical protein